MPTHRTSVRLPNLEALVLSHVVHVCEQWFDKRVQSTFGHANALLAHRHRKVFQARVTKQDPKILVARNGLEGGRNNGKWIVWQSD
jgi:hypothetical protein